MKAKIYLFTCLILTSFFIGCSGDEEAKPASFKMNVNLNMDNYNNLGCAVESPNAHSGKKICHLDSGVNFGFYYTFKIPDSLIGKALSVSIDSWIRSGKKENECGVVCTVNNAKDSLLLWHGLDGKAVITQPNEWSNLSGTFIIPSNMMISGYKINIMCYNSQASSYFDVDDLDVQFSEPEKNQP